MPHRKQYSGKALFLPETSATSLRNHLGAGTLNSLLRIKMECVEQLEDQHLEELVDKFKCYLIDLAKSGQIRIDI